MVSLLSSHKTRNTLLWLCVLLPWLNPFTSPPSSAVVPLLVSWMLAACALLVVADLPMSVGVRTTSAFGLSQRGMRWQKLGQWGWGLVVMALLVSLLSVPKVIDVGATAGLLAALVCMVAMVAVGRRVACSAHRLMGCLLGAWLTAAVISSVLALMQYLDMASELAPWVNQPAFKGDAFANLRQRNQFASLTSIGLVVLLALTHALQPLQSEMRATLGLGQRRWMWLGFVLLNLLAIGAACSMSRTGVLQWVVVSGLAFLWAWRQRSRLAGPFQTKPLEAANDAERDVTPAWWCMVCGAPLCLLLWSWAMPWVSQHITGQLGANLALRVAGSAQDYGVCGSRSVLWANVWHLMVQKPWLGWGWGQTDLAHFLALYSGPRFCDILDNAHNLPLHLALELGLPLALAVLLLVGAWVWLRRPWQEQNIWRVMAWGVLVVVSLHSLLEYPLWYGPFQMAVGLCVGLLWLRPSHAPSSVHGQGEVLVQGPTISHDNRRAEVASIVVAGVFFCACLYAAWDYHRVSQIYRPPELRDPRYSRDPLGHAKQSVLFQNQAAFAELTLQEVTASNAQAVYAQAQRVVHYSPEPRVVQRLIDSARRLGREEEADLWATRLTAHQHAVQR